MCLGDGVSDLRGVRDVGTQGDGAATERTDFRDDLVQLLARRDPVARRSAVARPIPRRRAAPVTSATRPAIPSSPIYDEVPMRGAGRVSTRPRPACGDRPRVADTNPFPEWEEQG